MICRLPAHIWWQNHILMSVTIAHRLLNLYSVEVDNENAEFVDTVYAERRPKAYIYPSQPHVTFWDMPGYGTPSDPDAETHWRKFRLEMFDTFLIFISATLTALDLNIIQKIKTLNKSYFLIRTKIDVDGEVINRKPQLDEPELLKKMRDFIVKQTGQMSSAADIFLISSYYPYKWDFVRLIEAIVKIMPDPEIGEY